MAKPTQTDTHSASERYAEVVRAEQQAGEHEAWLEQEVLRLEGTAGALLGRAQHLKSASAQLHLAGVREPAFVEVHRRTQQHAVPRLNPGRARDQALSARIEAVNTRIRAAADQRQAIQAHAEELTRLSSQLSADEAEVARFEALQQERVVQRERELHAAPAAPIPLTPVPLTPLRPAGGRRASARVRMQAAIDFGSDSNFFNGFSTDISAGGLFIATVQSVPLGTSVDLQFTLPGGGKITAHGVVRWTREVNDNTPDIFPGVGVQFADLSPQASAAIAQFVSSREPLFYPD